MLRLGAFAVAAVFLSAAPLRAQAMTASELDRFADLPAMEVTGEQVQTLWLKGFIAGLKTASEITDAGNVKTIVDAVWECIADYSHGTILSIYKDWLRVHPEWIDGRAREAVFFALLEHCS